MTWNANGEVQALDALLIINALAGGQYFENGTEQLIDAGLASPFPDLFFDTTQDGNLTALDALVVINFLARQGLTGEAEGVSVDSVRHGDSNRDDVFSRLVGIAAG